MTQKEKCEAVVLTDDDKKLLKEIKKHPGKVIDKNTASRLCSMGLISRSSHPMYNNEDPACSVLDFYEIYMAYTKNRRRVLWLQSFWMPLAVSFLVSVATNIAFRWLP